MDQWLIRTSNNWIAGPYSAQQICQMVLEQKLTLQDEVCTGNGYWIFIHERDEIKKALGIDVPKAPRKAGEDFTETQKELVDDEVTDPDITSVRNELAHSENQLGQTEHTAVIQIGTTAKAKSPAPEAKEAKSGKADTKQKTKKVEVPQVQAEPIRSPATKSGADVPKVQVVGGTDHPSFWRGFAWVLILTSGLLVFVVFHFLKRP